MKKVLLIVLPYIVKEPYTAIRRIRSFKGFPYGLLSMATYAKNHCMEQNEIKILDCNSGDYSPEELVAWELNSFNPDIVGMSIMFDNSYKYVGIISRTVKELHPETFLVLGGAGATSSYKAILEEQSDVDGICFSEGEAPFSQLLDADDPKAFVEKSISWVTRNTIAKSIDPKPTVLLDLDEAIDIDYSLVNPDEYGMREAFSPFSSPDSSHRQFFVVSSRGCPYKCVFCMRSADKNKSMRYASVDKIISHVKHLVDNYGMKVLTFYDDQLLLNRKRAKLLFTELARFNLRIECPNGLSVAFIDEELAKLMKAAGMDTAYLAIESGSPHVLNKIIRKPLKLSMVKPVVDMLRSNGFWIQGFFVSGLPGEEDTHRKETLQFIKEVEMDWNSFSLAVPSRGSTLHKICVEKGYIPKDMRIDELDATKYIINVPGYPPEYVSEQTYLMQLESNFVNNRSMKYGEYEIASRAFRYIAARHPNHAFSHYYLSKALEKLGKYEESRAYTDKFENITKSDNEWNKFAKHFGLIN